MQCNCKEINIYIGSESLEYSTEYLIKVDVDEKTSKKLYQCKHCSVFWEKKKTSDNSEMLQKVDEEYIYRVWNKSKKAIEKAEYEYAKKMVLRELLASKKDNIDCRGLDNLIQEVINITYGQGGSMYDYSAYASEIIKNNLK